MARSISIATEAVSVLIVEDEALIALWTSEALSDLGYEVTGIAATAEAALRSAAEHRPDVALMDITLSGSADGIAAARSLKDRFGIPTLFATAHADSATKKRAETATPIGYLVKPFSPAQLENALARACDAIGLRP